MKKMLFLLALLYTASVYAQLQPGDPCPSFTATDDTGNTWNSSEVIGKQVVVFFFYPAAMTGGCTKQACAFRDSKSQFESAGASVLGISGDEVQNLKYFKEAYDLNFPLLSDFDGTIAKQFGVPVKDGGSISRTIGTGEVALLRGVTTSRWTFIIDKTGKVAYIKADVNAEDDSKEALELISKL